LFLPYLLYILYIMNKIFYNPSFYVHIVNGFLLLLAIILFIIYYKKITIIEPYKLIILILIFSIAVGIHGLSHLGLEKSYNYNPVLSFL